MPDLEEGIEEELMDAPAVQAPAMAEDLRVHQVEGGTVAGKMNPGQKMWLAYWLLVCAASVIFLNNHIDAAPKDQLFPPELPMLVVFLCEIYLILRAMKQLGEMT